MAEESTHRQPVTQITVVEPEEGRLEEVLFVMKERARFMTVQPGFLSIILHRSTDGKRIVNYIQWQNRELLQKAHHSPEFRDKWDQFGSITDDIAPDLYEIEEILTPANTGG
jgi:heme-degrading monooxygenase HmoA